MKVAVVGYASLDYVVRIDSAPRPDRTSTVLSRAAEWPRLGGSPAYIAAALIAGGVGDAIPISWVGDDSEGERYRASLARLGVRADGIGVRAGRTPVCILAYEPNGGCDCLFDPGLESEAELDDAQRALIASASAVCVTVGPAGAVREALALARRQAAIAWVVKADPRAFPPDLAVALANHASVVIFNRGEATFVKEALSQGKGPAGGRILVETRGRKEVEVLENGRVELIPVNEVKADDPTGAGDAFAGGFLAAWLPRRDAAAAAKAGAAAARELLQARTRPAPAG
ncbi:MAG TPA: PfkB family carbohydrate kinase [Roseiarcus sp.]|nr:PfkB family carbohydrate kinase [Roseiarcus sp.]